MAVPQYLAETETQLTFLIVVADAFDLGDEDGSVRLPREVEVRLGGQRGAWFDSCVPQNLGEVVLCVCVTFEAAFDNSWIGSGMAAAR